MSQQSSPEANEAYRRGDCVDCLTSPQSAGRPRCGGCHEKRHQTQEVTV